MARCCAEEKNNLKVIETITETSMKEAVDACCHSFETNRGRCFDCPCSTLRVGDDEDDFFDDDDFEEE